jgi:ubiquinone/menaquinone biosynthesis C-methylase UbiE
MKSGPFQKRSPSKKPTTSKVTQNISLKTSWGREASWYSEHLEQGDTYHAKVILPNLERVVAPAMGMRILEIGCGEGFFARAFAKAGATVLASDIGKELIAVGKEKGGGPTYHVSPGEDLTWVKPHSQEVVVAVLTLQNMEKIEPVMKQVAWVLKKGGRFIFVLNHPAFRIPKASAWGFDEESKTQYRRVDAYLSARKEKMDMHPGKKRANSYTYSFHRSLQDYMKGLRAAGLAITRLEEWISHKTSEPGPKAKSENIARKEFPLFMMIEARMVE